LSNIVKYDSAESYRSAPFFDLADIEAQAAAIVSAAEASASAIIEEAAREGARIQAKATEDGRVAGLEAAREEGLRLGRAEGRQQAFDEARGEITVAAKCLVDACAELAAAKDGLFTQAEKDLLKLALFIASKIVAREVIADAHVTADNVKRCLDMLSERKNLAVRVAPSAVSVIEQQLPELAKRMGDLSSVKIIGDEKVSTGGCLITAQSGVIDATIEGQFQEVERILFGGQNA
jgi:flagellar assembly protein FliH